MDVMNVMMSGEEVIFVMNLEIFCIIDMMKVGIVFRKVGLVVFGFVFNCYGRSENDILFDVVEEVMEVFLFVVIFEDLKVREVILEGVLVVEYVFDLEGVKVFMVLVEEVSRIVGFKVRVMG